MTTPSPVPDIPPPPGIDVPPGTPAHDPIPDPEPPSPSLPESDPGTYQLSNRA